MITAATKRKSGFYIEVTCPGCGGTLDLDDDFFVLGCEHCGCVHRVVLPETPVAYLIPARIDRREARFAIDRYLKKHSLPLTGGGIHLKKLYYPYWKIDAILFRLRNKTFEKVIAEESEYHEAVIVAQDRTEMGLSPYTTTLAAGHPFDGIPKSLGLRTEYIKLQPYARENVQDDFDSLPVTATWDDIRRDLLLNLGTISDMDHGDFGSNVTELFHPKASLVYFPFFIMESYSGGGFNRYVVDGVAGRMHQHVTQIDTDRSFEGGDTPNIEFGALRVEHHRCGNCGVDLPADQSYVYICGNCHELVVLGDSGRSMGRILAAPSGARVDRMFPFWSFGLPADSNAALRTLFAGIHGSNRLVIPAFKIQNFDAMFNLARRMSAAMPQLELSPLEKLDERFVSVGTSLDDAIALTEVVIFRQSFSRQGGGRIAEHAFAPQDVELVYMPFHPESYFYVDSVINAVTFARKLAP